MVGTDALYLSSCPQFSLSLFSCSTGNGESHWTPAENFPHSRSSLASCYYLGSEFWGAAWQASTEPAVPHGSVSCLEQLLPCPLTCLWATCRSWTLWLTAWCLGPSCPVKSARASWSSKAMPITALATSLPGPSVWSRRRHRTGRTG